MNYKHILLATDFIDENRYVVDKAKALATSFNAKLSLVHVTDSMPLPSSEYGLEPSFEPDLTGEMIALAKKNLLELADELGVSHDNIWVELGSPKLEIPRVAEENQVDLIVIGSHGKHGLSLLLGSTSTGVLHHAKCDVLAVRLPDE